MRCIVQRVKSASVLIDGEKKNKIGNGLMVLCAFEEQDEQKKIDYVADKILNLRIFSDENDKLNLSLFDTKGDVLIVSNFTLYGDCSHGRRPSFVRSAHGDVSEKMYDYFVAKMKESGLKIQTGKFGADMLVDLKNDGPVTLIVESKE